MKLNKLIAIATISLLSGGISMAQKALNLEDIVAVLFNQPLHIAG